MLRSPRPIPRRYVRRVTRGSRRIAQKYHRPRRRYSWERFRRHSQRWSQRLQWTAQKAVASFWWLLGGALLGIVLITLFSPLLTVRSMRVARRDPRIDVELVEQALRPLFGMRMLFVRQQDIEPLLKEDLPEVKRAAVPDMKSLAVGKEYPSTLILEITPATLIAQARVLQPDMQPLPAGSGTTLLEVITEDGMLAAYLPSEVPDAAALMPVDIVDWGARPQPWTHLADPEVFNEIRRVETLLRDQFGQGVQRRVLYLRAQEYHFLLDDGLSLWLDRRSPVDEQLARYKLFLQVTPRGVAKQYVDLRLHDRIVYR